MTSNDPIRVGLIGHGLAGGVIHAPLIEGAGGYRITAVATSRDLSARRDGPRATAAEELVAADDVDLVVIASPNESHFPLAQAALGAGKHVVIDKPFVLSTVEADALIALAEAQGRILSVFHNRRTDGDFLAVKQAIASGELGEVLLFEAHWDRWRPAAPPAWRNSAAPGAGMLWDLGPHLIDQALQLFGEPDSLTADIAAQREGALADDYFELTLRYGARRVILGSASVVAEPRPRFAAHGTKGSLLTFGVDPIEAALKAGAHPGDASFQAGLPPIAGVRADGERREDVAIPAGSWLPYYRQLAAAIRGEAEPPVPAREARRVIAMIEEAFAGT